tara:strand:- start:331 stop:1554 length:1224 start_codon:yes stop_codon:yes gene_type:complete
MGVVIQPFVKANESESNTLLCQLKELFTQKKIAECTALLKQYKKSDHNKFVNQTQINELNKDLKLFWNFTNQSILDQLNIEFPYSFKRKKTLNVMSLKVRFYDKFIEGDWKKQYQGKYGGPKDSKYSWKEWYFKNEAEIEPITNFEEKMKWAINNGHENYLAFLLTQQRKKKIKDLLFEHNTGALSLCIVKDFHNLAKDIITNNQFDNKTDDFGWTDLHHAVYCGNFDICKLLLQKKKAVNCKDNNNLYPIHVAVIKGYYDIVKLLLKHNAKLNYKDSNGNPPLYYALLSKDIDIIDLLLDYGADLKFKDSFGYSYLHIAAKLGLSSIVKYLIKQDIHINEKDKFNRTPLHYAIEFSEISCIDILLKAGANFETIDCLAQTPLITAANNKCKGGITLLNEFSMTKHN